MTNDLANRVHKLLSEAAVLVDEIAKQRVTPTATPSNQKKLTRREADRIRDLKRNGLTHQAIADIFDVNRSTITRIINKTYWK